MYLEYYNLKEKPFSLTPDPAFIYYSAAHRRAISFLRYGLQESKGFLQLTGPVGSGKTTLLRAVLDQLHEKTRTAYIINPCASFPDLLRAIMKDLEISNIPPTCSKLELLDFFHDYLLIQMRRNSPVILIFDESQNLSLQNLEELRMLSNFETSKEKLLQIVFVGQPEFVKTIDLPELRQLKQRIQVRYHLSPLRFHEVKEYINHRLEIAGSTGKIVFTDEACDSIFTFSGGIPRLINAVCDVVLLIGYVTDKHRFGKDEVNEAVQELEGGFDEDDGQVVRIERPSDADQPPAVPPQTPPADNCSPAGQRVAQNGSSENLGTLSTAGSNKKPETHKEIPSESATSRHCIEPITSSLTAAQDHRRAPGVSLEPDRPNGVNGKRLIPLHSFLRHRSAKKFHVGGAGLLTLDANERMYDRDFLTGRIIGQRESSVNALSQALSDKPSRFDQPPQETGEYTCRDGGNGETTIADKKADVSPENDTSSNTTASYQVKGMQFQPFQLCKKLCSLLKRQQRRLKPVLTNGKAIIVYKNGVSVKGKVKELVLEKSGFQFLPLPSNGLLQEEFVLFHQICAVYIVEEFSCKISTDVSVPHNLKGRHIFVVLLNGETLEGMMLDQASLDSPRFYLIVSGGKQSCWALIEKSGTLGILSEKYRTGIYAGRLESLEDNKVLFAGDLLETSSDEASADTYFSSNEFEMAVCKYRKLTDANPHSGRLAAKLSLCYHNLGIQLVHMQKYEQAKKAFEKISNYHLRERVSSVMEGLDILTRTASSGITLDGRLKEGFQCRKLSVH